ncbi:hypothetical protein [Halorientalis pallida]|uniref:Uncharacterized protein n=1 Tax=Halorientalis pallida TaxID=2479928 RepID=A0A498KQQ8_9EURY|nr:hypothetical protein [Halorientalis pallida]RXK46295.1 hypothetical protein EAF64_19655 [Halorientalis pallida]
MARDDTTDDEGAATDGDPSAGRSDGLRARFDRWVATRPTLGATLLTLGSAVLGWRVLAQLSAVPLGRITPVGVAGATAPFVAVVLGLFVLARPEKTRNAGGVGFGLVGFTFAGLLLSGVPFAHPELAFTGFVIGGIGAVICLAWDHDSTVRIERGPVFRAGRAALVCGLVLALAFTAAPAVSGDTFPAQSDTLDGFVVSQSSLDSGMYSYQTDCDTDPGFAIGGEDCIDITVDSTSQENIDRAARQQLDSTSVADVDINDFLIYENLFTDLRGGKNVYFELTASQAVASSETDDGRAIDVYISEFRSEKLTARLDLIEFPGTPGIPADNIAYWSCTPQNDSGFGTINDIRLGLDTNPRLTDGRDVSLLAHQLGSSETVLTDFKLEIGAELGNNTGVREPIPADDGPTTPPSNCL